MSDYAQITDFSAKDALTSGDPEKLILGSDVDDELSAISVAVATKYDSNDLASQAQAEAEAINTVLLTPLRLAQWADYNAGVVGDLQALADPGADRIFGWDESANAAIAFALSTGLVTSGTNLLIDTTVVPQLAASNVFTGAVQTITANGAIFNANSQNAGGGYFQWSTSNTIRGYIGNGVTITGGAVTDIALRAEAGGLLFSGNAGTTIHFALSAAGVLTTPNASASEVGYKGIPSSAGSSTGAYTLAVADAGKVVNATGNITVPENSTAIPNFSVITIVNGTIGDITISPSGSDTLRWSGTGGTDGARTLRAYQGIATLIKLTSTLWLISGDIY